jgi:hypothetical protein
MEIDILPVWCLLCEFAFRKNTSLAVWILKLSLLVKIQLESESS